MQRIPRPVFPELGENSRYDSHDYHIWMLFYNFRRLEIWGWTYIVYTRNNFTNGQQIIRINQINWELD